LNIIVALLIAAIAIVAIWFMELPLARSVIRLASAEGVPLVAGDVHPHLQRHRDAVTRRLRKTLRPAPL
jgi:hypothetical protein